MNRRNALKAMVIAAVGALLPKVAETPEVELELENEQLRELGRSLLESREGWKRWGKSSEDWWKARCLELQQQLAQSEECRIQAGRECYERQQRIEALEEQSQVHWKATKYWEEQAAMWQNRALHFASEATSWKERCLCWRGRYEQVQPEQDQELEQKIPDLKGCVGWWAYGKPTYDDTPATVQLDIENTGDKSCPCCCSYSKYFDPDDGRIWTWDEENQQKRYDDEQFESLDAPRHVIWFTADEWADDEIRQERLSTLSAPSRTIWSIADKYTDGTIVGTLAEVLDA